MRRIMIKERDSSRYFQAFNSKLYLVDSFAICIAVFTQDAKFLGTYGKHFCIMKNNVEQESFFSFSLLFINDE